MDELRAQIGGGHAVRVPLEGGGGGDRDGDHDHDHEGHDHEGHDHEGHDHGHEWTAPVGPPGRPMRRRAPRSGGTPA
jgi:hypothetical protein